MRRRIKEYALLFISLFLLVQGCERKEKPLEITLHQENSPSVRIGVVPAITVKDTIEQYQPIADYLGGRLNIDARLMPQKDYLAVLEKMRSGAIDAGIMGSLICYRAIKELGAVPLARPEINGASTYEGVVFTRKDSGIRDIRGLRGRSFAYVDRDTSAGYVYPNFLLEVIAEGVETAEQLNLLRRMHCDKVQGFLISRPVPSGEVEGFLAEGRRFLADKAD